MNLPPKNIFSPMWKKYNLTTLQFGHKIFIRIIWALYINDYTQSHEFIQSLTTANSEQEENLTNRCVKEWMNSPLERINTLAASH